MSDYAYPERRKNRSDRKAKSKFNKFKKGGRFRTIQNIVHKIEENLSKE